MKTDFEILYDIAKMDPGTLSDHLGKLLEEAGEFATAVNMINGRKTRKKGETDEQVRTNVIEEAVDIIQVVGSILAKLGITYEELVTAFPGKNTSYLNYVMKTYQDKYVKVP